MSMYPVSGTATQAVPPNTGTGATGTTTVYSITSGRVFWLRGVLGNYNNNPGPIELYDATTQSTATTHALRALVTLNPDKPTTSVGLIEPGIRFSNNYVLARLSASGNIPVGGLTVFGYEEG